MKTIRTEQLPRFYTHGIGSLPRPQVVRDLLAQRQASPSDRCEKPLDVVIVTHMPVRDR